ncbi:MAG: hypothetical protein RR902_06750 [Oscillospiraceae bacterium]
MKKIFAMVLVLTLAISMVACGGSKLKDGTYKAETSDAAAEASHGWKDTLTVTVASGKVSDVDFESFDADGNKKSETTAETYPMDPHPTTWMPTIEANIKAAASPDEFVPVAGATNSSDTAKKLYAAILTAAADGKTDTIVVD